MKSRNPVVRPALLGLFASLLILWSCHLASEEAPFFNVKVDSTWTKFDSIAVVLADAAGNPLDTLFKGRLESDDQLKKLAATRFDGGKIQVILIGYAEGKIVKTESRPYDGRTGESGEKTVVITPLEPNDPTALDIKPDAVKLYTGGPGITLAPAGSAWADKPLDWSSSNPDAATVNAGKVNAVAPGKAWITAVSGAKRDSSEITVVTDAPAMETGDDTVIVLNAIVAFQVKVKQEFGGIAIFKWSLDGDTLWDDSASNFPAEKTLFGTTPKAFTQAASLQLRFYVRDGEGNATVGTRTLSVSQQAPKITSLLQDAEIDIMDSVAFTAQVEVNLGLLKKFTWDYGDGAAPVTGAISMAKGELTGGHVYKSEGNFKTTLTIEDNLGNQVKSSVTVKVKPAVVLLPPVVTSLKPGDTTITIKDSLAFGARISSQTPLKSFSWDFDNDASPETGGILSDTAATLAFSKGFPAAGTFILTVKATDNTGKTGSKQVTVTVKQDLPAAKAGDDTVVDAGTRVNLHGKASDLLGRVVKTEWKIGAGAFFDAPNPDTGFTAPEAGGVTIPCVFRVTDDDAQVVEDTVQITVSASSDADLSALTLSSGSLSPAFAKGVLAYSTSLPNSVATLTVTPTCAHSAATVKVNAVAVASGAASAPLALAVGANAISVEVTAKSGAKKTYVVTATRAGSSANDLSALAASAGTLSPAFTAGILVYAVTTTDTTTTVTAAIAAGSGASIKVNGVATASGTASAAIRIPAGATTTVPVVVTAQNGTAKTYSIAFTVGTPGLPDLVFTAAAMTQKTPTKATYSYTITNSGGTAIPNLYNVSIQNYWSANTIFNDAGDVAAGGSILGIVKSLAPGESHSGTFYGSGAVPAGLNYVTFKIDWGDSVAESNETNNTRALQVLVPPTASAGADTQVAAGTRVNLHGRAADPLGSVAKTEWKIGAGAFFNAPRPDTNFTAPEVGGTVQCTFRVTDDDGLVTEDVVSITVLGSTDADLASLTLSAGNLTPAFAKGTTAYAASVANTVASINVTPTVDNAGATLKINAVAATSGAAKAVALNPGANTISIEVTAQSGAKKTYTVTVTRALSAVADLSALTATAGTLSPVFAAGTLAYTVSTTSITTTITATVAAGSGATLKIGGTTVASGTASAPISIPAGLTTSVPIEVTAQDGTTKKTYTIAFTVTGSDLPDLVFTAAAITSVTATNVNYSYTIKNNGATAIPDIYNVSIQNFYSANTVFNDAGDDAAGGRILGIHRSLAAGETYSSTYAGSGAVPSGMLYLTFKIDWGEIIAETNETNNTKALLIP
jgi:hypothetical protein